MVKYSHRRNIINKVIKVGKAPDALIFCKYLR